MKKLFVILFAAFITLPSFAQLDRSKMPGPGPAPEINIGNYESFELDNGLKVFVVENDKLPMVSFSLILDRDPILESDSAGYTTIAGDLLRTGTKTKSKEEIDETVDFLGANLSTSSTNISGRSLKTHFEKLFSLASDIILNADFKQEELDKIKLRMISGLQAEKDDPNAIANVVRRAVTYGIDHPYGEPVTEATVDTVTLEMCKNYYETYFHPNIAYLAFVGAINKEEAEQLVTKYLGEWKQQDVPDLEYKTPKPPAKRKVALVDRPVSVQSVINITYPIQLKIGSPDAIKASVMNTILGGTSSSMLFENLREDKGYTYGAYSAISPDRLVGSFNASCQARNEVTDSSITEILKEMKTIQSAEVDSAKLESMKNYLSGSFARSLERPQTIASFAINTARYNLPKDYYNNYLKNIAAVTAADVKESAEKYIKPENSYVVVVGNAEEVEKGLKKFGEVSFYDIYGNYIDPAMARLPEGLTADKVIQDYIDAIGGKENLDKVQDRVTKMSGKVQGINVEMTVYQKAPDLLKQQLNAGVLKQDVIYNGEKGAIIVNDQVNELAGSDLEKLKYEAMLNLVLELKENGIETNLKGMEKIDGKNAYKIEMIFPDGTKWLQYYDAETGLKVKEIKTLTTPNGEVTQEIYYGDYREVNGVLYPYKIKQSFGPQSLEVNVESIEVNKGLTDKEFEIEE